MALTSRFFAGAGDLGAMQALASRGDAAYPVPTLLYESIGFRRVAGHLPYVRDR